MELLQIPHSRGTRNALPGEIIRVEASSNYSKIYFLHGQPMLVAKVLRWFEKQLPPQMFTRVHRSHLVNNNFIEEINGGSRKVIVLSNGEKIMMSRRRKILLMAG